MVHLTGNYSIVYNLLKVFRCIDGCSDCCVNREYFPSKAYGKIGVLLLPKEKKRIERAAGIMDIPIWILPRIGVGKNEGGTGPKEVLFYQLMGKNRDGNLCPFLEIDGEQRSPHGGARCSIYNERPIACKAYPLVSTDPFSSALDHKCNFCVSNKQEQVCNKGIGDEIKALGEIMAATKVKEGDEIWRYATNVGDSSSAGELLPQGWTKERKKKKNS